MPPRNVAILIFDDVEVLDFCGPFEVFSVTGKRNGSNPFNVYTVAEKTPTLARNKLSVNPHFLLDDCPPPDILVVPGGGGFHADGTPFGTRREMHNQRLLGWITQLLPHTEHMLSVCTGALVLGNAGLLNGLEMTTHHLALDALEQLVPEGHLVRDKRVVDNGQILLSAGVAAGIDASFHLIAKLLGEEVAHETARYIEYPWPGDGA